VSEFLAVFLARLIVELVGHEAAPKVVSAEAQKRAKALADTVAKSRGLK
jgi:hypothetical protein